MSRHRIFPWLLSSSSFPQPFSSSLWSLAKSFAPSSANPTISAAIVTVATVILMSFRLGPHVIRTGQVSNEWSCLQNRRKRRLLSVLSLPAQEIRLDYLRPRLLTKMLSKTIPPVCFMTTGPLPNPRHHLLPTQNPSP